MNSSELRGFLTGLILGDGSIDKGITRRAFNIKSVNFDFIDMIELELKSYTNFQITTEIVEARTINGVSHQAFKRLTTKAHPYFAKKYHFFYNDNGSRRITRESLNWLNERGLANWFMSDGYIVLVGKESGIIKDRRVEIATDRYSVHDVEKIKAYFEEVHGYKVHMTKRKEGVYRIRFSLLDAQNFFLLIAPYVVPSMRYKLNLRYDYRPSWMNDDYYNLMNQIA